MWYTSIPKISPWQVLASHFLADAEIKCSLPVYFLLAGDMHILAELWKQFFSWEKNKDSKLLHKQWLVTRGKTRVGKFLTFY